MNTNLKIERSDYLFCYFYFKADKSTTKSTSTSSSSGAVDTTGDSSKNLGIY